MRKTIRRIAYILVNVWLVFHVCAIVIAPASVPPAARIVQASWLAVGPYLQLFYLNHGFHFFAPEPAGATLIAYSGTLPDGTLIRGRIPNRDIRPRLLYHRHFMLTEHMTATLQQRPELEKLMAETYAHQLHRKTGANDIVLSRVWHELSSPAQVLAGRRIDDPLTYEEELLGEFNWEVTSDD